MYLSIVVGMIASKRIDTSTLSFLLFCDMLLGVEVTYIPITYFIKTSIN